MIRLEISLKARAGVAKRGVWGKERLVWNYMELHGCICAYVAMETYVLSQLSDYLQRCVSIWPYFWLKMEFC